MSTDSTASSPYLLVPTPSSSTNVVGEAILASDEDTQSDSPPSVPWRTGADTQLPRAHVTYIGHTNWRAHHQPEGQRRRTRRIRRKRYIVNEIGISRDFFLIITLCFVLACLLIVLLRPIVLEILWDIDDSY